MNQITAYTGHTIYLGPPYLYMLSVGIHDLRDEGDPLRGAKRYHALVTGYGNHDTDAALACQLISPN